MSAREDERREQERRRGELRNVTDDLLAAHVQKPPPRFKRIGCPDISAAVEGVVQVARPQDGQDRSEVLVAGER